MRNAIKDEDGIKIDGRHISNLRYADDTVLIANSEEKLQSLIDDVAKAFEDFGLLLNIMKN